MFSDWPAGVPIWRRPQQRSLQRYHGMGRVCTVCLYLYLYACVVYRMRATSGAFFSDASVPQIDRVPHPD